MSYLVLARKYRPQTFEDVLGQEHVTRTLRNAIRQDRVAHAYLFAGPRGVGKTSVARILAKAINCEKPKEGSPCNECPACKDITSGTCVDVIEIDAASNRGIDSVRELREGVRYAPARCKRKIYIIDEVHMLTTEAFNALLKTLEEPPAHVVFLFATTEAHNVLPTILSRCQRFDFRRITAKALTEQLVEVLAAEGTGMDKAALELVARLSDGGMRDALSLLDLAASSLARDTKKEPITEQEVADLAGVAGRSLVEDALAAVAKADGVKALEAVARLYEFGYDVRQFYGELLLSLRHALVLASVKGALDVVDLSDSARERLQAIFSGWDAPQIDQLFLILQAGEASVFRSPHQRLVLEALLLRMSQAGRLSALSSLEERLDRMEQSLSGGAGASPAGSAVPTREFTTPRSPGSGSGLSGGSSKVAAAGAAAQESLSRAVSATPGSPPAAGGLSSVLQEISSRKPFWKGFLASYRLVEEEGGRFALVPLDAEGARKARASYHGDQLGEIRAAVGAALGARLGKGKLEVRIAEDLSEAPPPAAPGAPPAAPDPSSEKSPVQQARENPIVQKVLATFEVESRSVRDTPRR